MLTFQEFALEVLRVVVPLGLAYVGVLKTRTELDILYAKFRGDEQTQMRCRWYHRLSHKKKEWNDVASVSSAVAVENDRQGVSGEVPERSVGEGAGVSGPESERLKD